jgi:hypothetical protein
MKRSRRKFLQLLAAGSAAAATQPAVALAARARVPRPVRAPERPAGPPPALRAEIERQQHDLDKTLKTLRDYPLEPGSDPAFVLTPLRAGRAEAQR